VSAHRKHPRRLNQQGFALLITITLLAFLVLLLVSLASLTRVETQVAGNNQQLSQARQNALMALDLAMGQLQKYAGPDQRVTARADLYDTTNSVPAASSGLVSPANGARYWTGVWARRSTAAQGIYTEAPTPVLLNWLVSGNESLTPDINPVTGVMNTSVAAAPAYLPSHDPALTLSTTATSPLTINGNPAVLLVGPNTTGGTPVVVGDLARYIAAPLISISVNTSSVPGLGSSGTTSIGRYAFWVGDEGVKSSYTARDPYAPASGTPIDPATTPADAGARYRFQASQRLGNELIAGFSGYPVNSTQLDQIVSPRQLSLADTALTAPLLNARYHDYSTYSRGVLADTLNGGLRRDLTHAFETGAILDTTNPNPNFSPAQNNILPAGLSPKYGPTWETLAAHYALAGRIGSIAAPALELSDAVVRSAGVTPTIVQTRFFWRLHIDADGTPYLRTFTVFALGNPYNVRLNASGGVDFAIDPGSVGGVPASHFSLRAMIGPTSPSTTASAGTPPGDNTRYNLYRIFKIPGSSEASALSGTVFRLPSLSLAPGEVRLFAISGTPSGTAVVPLAEIGGGGFPTNYLQTALPPPVTGPSTAWTAGTPAEHSLWGWIANAYFRTQLRLAGGTGVLQEVVNGVTVGNYQSAPGRTGSSTVPYSLPADVDLGGMPLNLLLPGADSSGGTFQNNHGNFRTYADYNLRARTHMIPGSALTDYNKSFFVTPPYASYPYAYGSPAAPNFSSANGYTWNLAAQWGHDLFGAQSSVILFDIPRRSGADDPPLLSLGALQHANATADDWFPFIGSQPGNAVGNSLFSPYVTTSRSSEARANTWWSMTGTTTYYDISYLLNTALWDRYFFSGIPPAGGTFALNPASASQTTLPNARLRIIENTAATLAALRDLREPAARLLINGAFNINSTSEAAWSALLAGTRNLLLQGDSSTGTPFPRQLLPSLASTNASVEKNDASYAGFRRLTDAQIATLATEIVKQVKLRGPFLSLSHFINRTLAASTSPQSLKGPLQAAIDNAALNSSLVAGRAVVWPNNGGDDGGGSTVGPYAENKLTQGLSASTGIPGWLSQADLLQPLGPSLAARSDTFVVRTYGDVLDPLNSTAATPVVISRAWCEAVVQRFPDYMDASSTGNAPTIAPSAATADNQQFGRRFRIVSFRWLTPDEI
jgi:hypothetical protein